MKSTWPVRSIEPCLPAVLSLAKNHRQTGMPVRAEQLGRQRDHAGDQVGLDDLRRGSAPSPPEFVDIDPLAITTPA